MKLFGLQKLTLLDYPQKVSATIFIGNCNMRCPFCHNSGLVLDPSSNLDYALDDLIKYLNKRKGILDGVCITGGEPLMYKGLEDLISTIKAMGYCIKLDSNGSFPNELSALIEANLVDYIAMDIKNCKEKYGKTVGIDNFKLGAIEESIKIIMNSKIDYEFRTTIVKEFHSPEDIESIAKWIKGAKAYYLQNFVDNGNIISKEKLHAVEQSTLNAMAELAKQHLHCCEIRGI